MGRDDRAATRRRFLASAAAGLAGVAGCVGRGQSRVRVLVAGSLQQAAAETLQARTDRELAVEAHGSVHAARLVARGDRDPAVVALADPALFSGVLDPPWYAVVASNELVVAYTEATAGGRRVRDADRWYEPLTGDGVALGRTDPTLDPLGYRTLFALRLAAARYDRPGLPEAVLGPEQTYPETQLLAQFETGGIDAAVVYRSMAVERDYPFRELPPAINLGDPAHAEAYRRVSYDLPDGDVVQGAPIEYAATRRRDTDAARAVFDAMLAGDWLDEHGFIRWETYPRMEGDVPDTPT
ncbi:extracellular solute-binding protein [Haloarcula litorea]|uniref:extracellular solute-binding protein n=1 Tax=Haloarcula litorea TaxID=3032579 RepID=UPI0023E8986C|nr:extracellular solute-binding protein [Halomicroarcula sp. GDY20]